MAEGIQTLAYADGIARPEANLYNYGYSTFLGSDYIDVDKINKNFEVINDRLAMAYVVGEGTNGAGWWYIQFSNGIVFFGLNDYNVGTLTLHIKWDDYYSTQTLTLPGTYPIPMASVPYFNIVLENYDVSDSLNHDWRFIHTNVSNTFSSTTTPPEWCLYWWPPSSYSDRGAAVLRNVHISAFGVGKIK